MLTHTGTTFQFKFTQFFFADRYICGKIFVEICSVVFNFLRKVANRQTIKQMLGIFGGGNYNL